VTEGDVTETSRCLALGLDVNCRHPRTAVTALMLAAEKVTRLVWPHQPESQQGRPVVSPGFVARRDKVGNYIMGHSWQTSGLGAAAAR